MPEKWVSNMTYVPYQEIIKQIDGVKKGDIVYVVSDILELTKKARENGERFNISFFVKSLQEKIGEEGTLLFPTFNWEFCKGKAFDYKRTPGKTGALGNKVLHIEGFKRSKHPIYSFAVWGKNQEVLCEMDPPNSFGKGTVFEFLHENDAKALVIGLPSMVGLTYIHQIEKIVGVPYRYEKEFSGQYIDFSGKSTEKTYTMYVRDLDMNPLHINGFEPLAKWIEQEKKSKRYEINNVEFHTLKLRDIAPMIEEDILKNDSRKMYHYVGQK